MGVVRNAWHPAAAVVAYQGWLCLGLVSGLLVADAWLAPLYASAQESTTRTLEWVMRQQQRLQMELLRREEEEDEAGDEEQEDEEGRGDKNEVNEDEDESMSLDLGGNSSGGDAALLMAEEAAFSGNSSSGHSSSRSHRKSGRSHKYDVGVRSQNSGINTQDVLFRIVHAVVSAGRRILRISLSWAALSFVFRIAFQLLQSSPPGEGRSNSGSSSRNAHGISSSSSSSAFGSTSMSSFTGSSGFGLEGAAEHALASALSEEAERLARMGLSAAYFHPVLGSDGAWLGAWAMPLLAAALLLAACERRSAAASSSSSSSHAKSSKSSSSRRQYYDRSAHSQTNFNSSAFSSNQLIAQLTPPRSRSSALDRTEPALVRSSSIDPSSCNPPPAETGDLPLHKTSRDHHHQSLHVSSSYSPSPYSSSSPSTPAFKEVPMLPQLARQNHFRATLLLCALAACAALAVCCWVVVTIELKGAALDMVTTCHKWGFALVCGCLAAPPLLKDLIGWCFGQLAISVRKVARCALCVLGFGSELQGDYLGGKGSSSSGGVGYYRQCFPYGSASERRKCARRVTARAILAGLAFLIVSWAYSFAAEKMPFQLPAQCYASSSSGGGNSVGGVGGTRGSGFLSWRSLRLQAHCSDTESFQLHYTDVYQEAYKQFKVCLRAHGNFAPATGADASTSSSTSSASSSSSSSSNEGRNRFLTLDRRVSSVCEPANQLVLQPVDGASNSATYCLYSPVRGLFVSASGRPSALCRNTERFTVTGRARPREALKGFFGLVPAFCKANFLVQSPWYALVAYAVIALCEFRRHSRSTQQKQQSTASRGKSAGRMTMICELVSASAWFMVSFHTCDDCYFFFLSFAITTSNVDAPTTQCIIAVIVVIFIGMLVFEWLCM